MESRMIIKDRNCESPESTLKVRYIANYGANKNEKKVIINPNLMKVNRYIPRKKYIISDLRKEHFNSFSNENMDFFRLDHLCECDRNNYHNSVMDNIKPINRSANFEKLNESAKNIKYLDYLKRNYLLNQNKLINKRIYNEKDMEIAKRREKYYLNKSQILKNTINLNPYKRDIHKSNSEFNLSKQMDYNLNNINNNNNINVIPKINNDRYNKINKNYSNSYLLNINDYSIKEGDIDLYKNENKLKLYPTHVKYSNNPENFKRIYNQNNFRSLLKNPFYRHYNENSKSIGFLKRKGDSFNYEKLYKNKFFFRDNINNSFNKRKNIINSYNQK